MSVELTSALHRHFLSGEDVHQSNKTFSIHACRPLKQTRLAASSSSSSSSSVQVRIVTCIMSSTPRQRQEALQAYGPDSVHGKCRGVQI